MGRIRQDAASRWMALRAAQSIQTRRCSFNWHARFGPVGLMSVRDSLDDAGGSLEVHALGFIRIARISHSEDLTRGELIRYLAEIAWAPQAILDNPALRWRQDGPDRLIVSAGSGASLAEVSLRLDNDGRIAEAFAADRPRASGRTFAATPWRGSYSDYRLHDGFWLPFRGTAGWSVGGTEFTYAELNLTQWETTRPTQWETPRSAAAA